MTLALLLTAATGAWADEANIGSITYNATLEAYEINNAHHLNDLAVYVNGAGTYSTGGSETTAHACTGLTFRLTGDIACDTEGLADGEAMPAPPSPPPSMATAPTEASWPTCKGATPPSATAGSAAAS